MGSALKSEPGISVDFSRWGPLSQNEVGHIAKSVARWVWERYVAGVPPLLREAHIAAQRERERERQKAREAARERSRVTRDEYTAQARQRRSEATKIRREGLSLRAIAEALRCSLGEVPRLLKACVQGSPGLSDFKGVVPTRSASAVVTECVEQSECKLVLEDEGLASPGSAGNGGAISIGTVSEYAASAQSAQPETDVMHYGRGVGEKPVLASRRSRIFSAEFVRSLRRVMTDSRRKRMWLVWWISI